MFYTEFLPNFTETSCCKTYLGTCFCIAIINFCNFSQHVPIAEYLLFLYLLNQQPSVCHVIFSSSISWQLTLSWRRFLSYRNQSIDLLCKLMNWFLYDRYLRHERVRDYFYINWTLTDSLSHSFCWWISTREIPASKMNSVLKARFIAMRYWACNIDHPKTRAWKHAWCFVEGMILFTDKFLERYLMNNLAELIEKDLWYQLCMVLDCVWYPEAATQKCSQ